MAALAAVGLPNHNLANAAIMACALMRAHLGRQHRRPSKEHNVERISKARVGKRQRSSDQELSGLSVAVFECLGGRTHLQPLQVHNRMAQRRSQVEEA